jgi:hypothetical protein
VEWAADLNLPNYVALLWNKYKFWHECPDRYFDAIVDNNPTSFAVVLAMSRRCCLGTTIFLAPGLLQTGPRLGHCLDLTSSTWIATFMSYYKPRGTCTVYYSCGRELCT